MPQEFKREYKNILKDYTLRQTEHNLYEGQNFSKQLIQKNISPEDVISIHKASLEEIMPELPENVSHSFDLLIEVMIHYGLALKEHQTLIKKQENFKMEMELAANVQKTLLKTKVPNMSGLDIGMISVPAKEMNGDYAYFLSDETNLGIAVADVIGKGIPAALCMSMIKYGMDGLSGAKTEPVVVLDIINRIVEKSVSDSMFISMFYGTYDSTNNEFTYASAGHEPPLFYCEKSSSFKELQAKGLLLGVIPNVKYEQQSIVLDKGDFVVMMTDGVTECRSKEGFIEQQKVMEIIESVKNEPAQVMVEYVFHKLEELQDFEQRDDFTLVILKKM
ncbi:MULTISPECIES: PP2C family protein-serine/threonine phosphatase [Bacillaceae]|uniref:PP2C family protein-serine/threonine phosphatase n=1 Tax=Bacillaceae TaxID=186817 RepID=UPI000700608B|nr:MULTISPECIES: PP2C family protein-serine/threonine phosphatase [Bacillaceae]KQL34935.1 phosphoserine phosphatase [Psychrobacillus sp. FJAT-21963]MDF2065270.1 PP2C family protein-serine/threonine phosphatase [Bacillus sp. Cr_A10]